MRTTLVFSFAVVLLACGPRGQGPEPRPAAQQQVMTAEALTALEAELAAKHGEAQRPRITRGIEQLTALWRASDGDMAAFAREHFISEPAALDATLARLESVLEQVDGHNNEIGRALRWNVETDAGPLLGVDPLLAGIDPWAHWTEDLFRSKAAFVALLNFPLTTLAERLDEGADYSRADWAAVRLAGRFGRRVPSEVQQRIAEVGATADLYIAEYNVWMHHVLAENGARLFPKGLRLISHWNLRDELKANYADPRGLEKQRTIARLMERIVAQEIPASVVNDPRVDWNPFTNEVKPAAEGTIEDDAPPAKAQAATGAEPNTRYAHWLAQFSAHRAADPYSPKTPTAILRSFELAREIPEERVRELLTGVLTSPVAKAVAAEIQKALAQKSPERKLEPFDIWYNGFQARGRYAESELDAVTRERYPTADAFARDIPRILRELGFPPDRASFIASHIVVDASRGAGHAMPALRRGDAPRLRTRVGKEGMDYKGYNIAVHELGHTVEEVISLYEVDHTLLAGVPNNAFTEAMAFVFQARDVELLGLAKPDPASERARVLSDFWATFEISGVALVDMETWHWLYDHPSATPAELRDAVVRIAKDVWNRYYAPVLGGTDTPILAVYSHLVAYPLYVTDYPLGHLIAFQIEEQFRKAPALGVEFERMARFGSVTPDAWMQNATGTRVSAQPLIEATQRALAQP